MFWVLKVVSCYVSLIKQLCNILVLIFSTDNTRPPLLLLVLQILCCKDAHWRSEIFLTFHAIAYPRFQSFWSIKNLDWQSMQEDSPEALQSYYCKELSKLVDWTTQRRPQKRHHCVTRRPCSSIQEWLEDSLCIDQNREEVFDHNFSLSCMYI